MKISVKKILQLVLFVSVGLILLYIVFNQNSAAYQAQCALDGVPSDECSLIDKILTDFKSVKWAWMVLVLLCFTLSNLSRAARWKMLIEPLGHSPSMFNLYFTTMIGYFANLGFPRIGEVIRAGTLAKYEGLRTEKVMGTVVVDRMVDMISFVIVLMLWFLIEFSTIRTAIEGLLGGNDASGNSIYFKLGVLAIVGIAGLFFLVKLIQSKSENKYVKKIQSIVSGFMDGLSTIRKVKNVKLFVFHSIIIWLMYFCMNYIGFHALQATEDLGMAAALTVFVSGALGIIIPSPGGMGSYHYFITEALKIYGVAAADGFSFANIMFFSIQLGCNISFGILGLILLPLKNRNRDIKA